MGPMLATGTLLSRVVSTTVAVATIAATATQQYQQENHLSSSLTLIYTNNYSGLVDEIYMDWNIISDFVV